MKYVVLTLMIFFDRENEEKSNNFQVNELGSRQVLEKDFVKIKC